MIFFSIFYLKFSSVLLSASHFAHPPILIDKFSRIKDTEQYAISYSVTVLLNTYGAPEWFFVSLLGTIHLRIPESSPVGTAIGSVKATDADTGKNAEVEYRIIDGDGTDMFDIVTQKDTQEGIITVRKVLRTFTKLFLCQCYATNVNCKKSV